MYSPVRDRLLKTEADRTKRITLRQKHGVLPVPRHGRIKILLLQNYIF